MIGTDTAVVGPKVVALTKTPMPTNVKQTRALLVTGGMISVPVALFRIAQYNSGRTMQHRRPCQYTKYIYTTAGGVCFCHGEVYH